ncbi:MAG: hypothetical protein NXH75_12240, partial [Halobacteriovoraceae bacterium]|nr:hypothetical protein [Halobacteriovoraceae bacterium]
DESILPRIVSLAEKGKLKIIGKGENYVDITYVDNVSQSIELALTCAEEFVGEKYNITNGEPIKQWNFINDLLLQLGFDPINKKVPISLAYNYAWGLEKLYQLAGNVNEPPLTRYKVGLLCYDQTLSIEKAKADLGYVPEVKMNEAIRNVVEAWKK